MGRSQVRLQTESETNRRYITIRNRRNGKAFYHKIYLRTKKREGRRTEVGQALRRRHRLRGGNLDGWYLAAQQDGHPA